MSRLLWSPHSEDRLHIDGVSLEYRAWGPTPDVSPTLVLLHEGLGSVALWRDFPERLSMATGLGVFAYSRQGYGQSDSCALPRPLDYMEREARDVLPRVLDQAGIRNCVLVGHSDGASIAALHQSLAPDPRVEALVLIAPHFFVEEAALHNIRNVRTAWRETDLPQRLGKYHADAETAFLGWNTAWLDPDFLSWDISDCIDAFRVPCLAFQGDFDEYGSAAHLSLIERRSPAPVSTHLIADCGHSPQKDQPEETLRLMSEFFKAHPPAPGQASS